MRSTFAAMFVVFVGIVSAADQEALNYRTAPGTAFVASLTFKPAEIVSVESAAIRFTFRKGEGPTTAKLTNCLIFDEAALSEKPLKPLNRSTLTPSEAVKIATRGGQTFIMKPKPAPPPEPVVQQPPAPPPQPVLPLPTLEQVRDVLKLDTTSNQNTFDLLSTKDRHSVLMIAGSIKGLKGVRSADGMRSIGPLLANMELFDRDKARKWMISRAESRRVGDFIDAMQIPEAKHEEVKIMFSTLDMPADTGRAIRLAHIIDQRGMGSLNPGDKEFVNRHRRLFGVE